MQETRTGTAVTEGLEAAGGLEGPTGERERVAGWLAGVSEEGWADRGPRGFSAKTTSASEAARCRRSSLAGWQLWF